MMTIAMFTFVLQNFCGVKDNRITKQEKIECIEFMVNCAIIDDGKTANKLVDLCKERWALNHNSLTRGEK